MFTLKKLLLTSAFLPVSALAQVHTYINIPLLSSEIVPAIESDAFGFATILYDDESNMLFYAYTWKLSKGSEATMAHFHGPASRGENAGSKTPSLLDVFGIQTVTKEGASQADGSIGEVDTASSNKNYSQFINIISGQDNSDYANGSSAEAKSKNSGYITGVLTLTEEQEQDLLAGKWYLNFHTTRYPDGEIRGQLIENTIDATIPYYDAATSDLQLPMVMAKPSGEDEPTIPFTTVLSLGEGGFVLESENDLQPFYDVLIGTISPASETSETSNSTQDNEMEQTGNNETNEGSNEMSAESADNDSMTSGSDDAAGSYTNGDDMSADDNTSMAGDDRTAALY